MRDFSKLERGKALFEQKNFREAHGSFKAGLKQIGPDRVDPYYLLLAGTAALYAGDLNSALYQADRVLEADPRSASGLLLKAYVLKSKGSTSTAYRTIKMAYQLYPHHKSVRKLFHELEMIRTQVTHATLRQNKKEPPSDIKKFQKQRRWVRKPSGLSLFVNDFGQRTIQTYSIESLSGGGALLGGVDEAAAMKEFPFLLTLSDGKRLWGTAEILYTLPDQKKVGVRFADLELEDAEAINREVLQSV